MTLDIFPETVRRPNRSDHAVIQEARKALLAEVNEWLADSGSQTLDPETDYDEYDGRLIEALDDGLRAERDGYEFARALEDDAGFSPDARLVEILDGASMHLSTAYGRAVQHWVESTGVQPRLAVGATVQVTVYDRGLRDHEKHSGTIASIDTKRATYTVRIPAMGHVPAGQLGTQGVILAWEDVEAENPLAGRS